MPQEHDSGSEKDFEGEGEEDATEETFEIEQCWVIKDRKRTWVPTTVMKLNEPYIKLSKFDRGFVHFCLSKPMSSTSKHGQEPANANTPAFDNLVNMRVAASVKAAQEQMEMEESQVGDSVATKQRKRKVREQDCAIVNPVVMVQLPPLEWKGRFYEGREVKLLWGMKSKDVWLHLNVVNLSYIRAMIASEHEEASKQESTTKQQKKHIIYI